MNKFVGTITAIAGVLGLIGSLIAMRLWLVTVVVLSILKITGLIIIPWFAGIFSAGAISTGLWMLFGGFVIMLISYVITFVGASFMSLD